MATPRFIARLFGPRFIKRWMPTSLFGRTLLIIILPMGLMQLAVTLILFNIHWETVTSRLTHGVAGDVASIVDAWKADPSPAAREAVRTRAQETQGLSIIYREGPLPGGDRTNIFESLDRTLRLSLDEELSDPFWFDTTRYPNFVDIRVKVDTGQLVIIAPRDHVFAPSAWIFVLLLPGSTLLLALVSLAFIRNQVRAIERLATAANSFGRGGDVSDFRPHGAREVREAGVAFMTMRYNIQRHLEQRTALLASVSHDLRTPLTRLNLELALADPTSRTKAMRQDLSEMEHMIDEYLDFARGEGGETVEDAPLRPLIEQVADNARRAGTQIEVSAIDIIAPVRVGALRRALANLVGNAATHGKMVQLTLQRSEDDDDVVEIIVDDDGPGLSPHQYEDAFKAFNRLDEARNQNKKGVGLGLAIARDVARSHGGEIVLGVSPLGGLRAVVRLPA